MALSLFSLKGKRALVTGAAQGIGFILAKGLSQAGAEVILNARNEKKLNSALELLKSDGRSVKGCLFDITNPDQVKDSISLLEQEGPIDISVNNAGIIRRAPAEYLKEEDWEAVIRTDLTAPFLLSKYVGKGMIQRKKGKIINICSLMSELGRDTVSAYAAAKGGLKMLTRNLATEWAIHNIQVNGIGPGYIATDINTEYRTPGNPLNDCIINRTPAGRWGTPEDLIGATLFLASDASNFVNGQIIYVDGGLISSFGKPPMPPINE